MKITNIINTIPLFSVLNPTAVMALPFDFSDKLGLESSKWQAFDQHGEQIEQETGARYVLSGFLHSKPEPETLKWFVHGICNHQQPYSHHRKVFDQDRRILRHSPFQAF
jgi:hypothetical protein